MFEDVTTVLRSPATFFVRADGPLLRSGAAVALLSGVALVLVALPLVWLLRFVLPAGELARVVGATVLVLPGFALVRWLVLAGVVYATGRLLGGEARPRALLGYLGWSFLPNVLATLVLLVGVVLAVSTVEAPTTTAAVPGFGRLLGESPLFQLAAAASLVRAETGVSLRQLQLVLGLVQFAWNASIWYGAATVALSLDDRRALAAIAVPVAFTGYVAGVQHVDFGVAL